MATYNEYFLFYIRKLVITINIFGKDAIIGDFQLSNYGLILASFEGTDSHAEELGMNHTTIEEYIGHNPVPVYLGSSYNSKLTPTATIIKDPSLNTNNDQYFSEHECREVLRQLTGFRGYKQMQIFSYEFDELLFFNIRVTNVRYQTIGGRIAGIILDMECDSQFAWSSDFNYMFNATQSSNIIFFNTSDNLYDYSYPKVTIKMINDIPELSIINLQDNNWTTIFKSLYANEIITMDSKNKALTSSNNSRIISNDFNMHFIRLVPGKNEFKVNGNVQMTFTYKVPRKVGFVL